jgi:hypothetical protein
MVYTPLPPDYSHLSKIHITAGWTVRKLFEEIHFCHFWDKPASDKMEYGINQ